MITRAQKAREEARARSTDLSRPALQDLNPVLNHGCSPTIASIPSEVTGPRMAKMIEKMHGISLDSDSMQTDTRNLERDSIVLSSSSEPSGGENSSDESDDNEIYYSDDEDLDDVEVPENVVPPKTKSQSSRCLSESVSDKVIRLIRDNNLQSLKLDECRTYLRQHGLIVGGNKPVLIDRIDQHYKLKTSGSKHYDRSTFVIDCTGDVCKGDVVMFDQKVSEKFDANTRGATLGRTVAGRIVKESYGVQCQQHTFTVEVLWSTGFKKLAPMKQLLIKGRKLYSRRIVRQRWADEEKRERTIDEKHKRGGTARLIRAKRHGRIQENHETLVVEMSKQQANPFINPDIENHETLVGKKSKQLANPYISTITENHETLVVEKRMQLANPYNSTVTDKENCSGENVPILGPFPVSQNSQTTAQASMHGHTAIAPERRFLARKIASDRSNLADQHAKLHVHSHTSITPEKRWVAKKIVSHQHDTLQDFDPRSCRGSNLGFDDQCNRLQVHGRPPVTPEKRRLARKTGWDQHDTLQDFGPQSFRGSNLGFDDQHNRLQVHGRPSITPEKSRLARKSGWDQRDTLQDFGPQSFRGSNVSFTDQHGRPEKRCLDRKMTSDQYYNLQGTDPPSAERSKFDDADQDVKQAAFRFQSFGVRDRGYTNQYGKVQEIRSRSFEVSNRDYTETRSISTFEQRQHSRPSSATSDFHDRGLLSPPPLFSRGIDNGARQEVRHVQIPCPTANCRYLKSKYCSSELCYYCCKKNGEQCNFHWRHPGMTESPSAGCGRSRVLYGGDVRSCAGGGWRPAREESM